MFRNGTGGFNGMVCDGCTKKPFMPSILPVIFAVMLGTQSTRPLLRLSGWLVPTDGKLR